MSFFTVLVGSKIAMGALTIGAVAVGGTAAVAYTGNLPVPTQQVAHVLIGAPAPTQAEIAAESASSTDAPASTPAPTATAIGPDATGPAAFGLCTAFTHGGLATTSTAYASLVTAASGSTNIAAYCATVVVPGKADSHRPAVTDGSSNSKSHDTSSDPTVAPSAPVLPTQATTGAEHKKSRP